MDKKVNHIIEFMGEMNERNIKLLLSSIISKKDMNKEEKEKGILVSLKSVIYKNNQSILIDMANQIDKICQKMGIGIAFIDYTVELYAVLKKATKETHIKLFKNNEVATIFLDPLSSKKGMGILLYDDDEENSKKLSVYLSQYNFNIVRAKSLDEFLSRMKVEDYDVVVTRSALNKQIEKKIKTTKTLSLSKKLIMNLPAFMNKAADTLVSFTGLEAKKVAHSIKNFDTTIDDDNICAVMKFQGDIEGFFTLIFPKNIAIIALESLLGETVKEDDTTTLKDGIGEFCNIITGATKTLLDGKDIKVVFELPKTNTSLNDTKKLIGTNNGVWMDMQLSGKPFYMFITK